MMACPKCHLPKEDSAWQCDGCGLEFSKDFHNVRADLRAQLRTTRIVFWLSVVVALAMVALGVVGGVVFLLSRWLYLCVSLMAAVLGSIGAAAHKTRVLRGHLRLLDRRHVPLPAATLRHGAGRGTTDRG